MMTLNGLYRPVKGLCRVPDLANFYNCGFSDLEGGSWSFCFAWYFAQFRVYGLGYLLVSRHFRLVF